MAEEPQKAAPSHPPAPSQGSAAPKAAKAASASACAWKLLALLILLLAVALPILLSSSWASVSFGVPPSSQPLFHDWQERIERLARMRDAPEGWTDSALPPRFRVNWAGGSHMPDELSITVDGILRIQVLHAQIARLEVCRHSPTASLPCFEDRPSQTVWTRDLTHVGQEKPEVQVERSDCSVVVTTSALRVTYDSCAAGDGAFVADAAHFSVYMRELDETWTYATHSSAGNLYGTCRTLDRTNGKTPLTAGLLSRAGWNAVDDSFSVVYDEETGWYDQRNFFSATGLTAQQAWRRQVYSTDLYFFVYGSDYQFALDRFADMSGGAPMIPRYALGNWWSRWWDYTDTELAQLVADFQQHQYPLGVLVIDMDWHNVQTGVAANPGWTGYTWNTTNFRNPPEFLKWVKEDMGLHVTLNLHPSEGCWPHEEAYPAFAELMGVDAAAGTPIAFNCSDSRFMAGYFDLLHHPHEEIGVDFWWIDWQQGGQSHLQGADPLAVLNHYHFLDSGRERSDGEGGVQTRRPFIFSRWPGLGAQRYPIGFSGDTTVSWESLSFQPYQTSTSANVLFGWWSHDIGGFMEGQEDPELYTRWVQFGVFSPMLRVHSVKSAWIDRRPWTWSDLNVQQNVRAAMQLRHALVPYLYSMAWRNVVENLVLVRPMYHEYPEEDVAYCHLNQYFFGSELLVAPFIRPMDESIQQSRAVVWLPPGAGWYDFFTGEYYAGDQVLPFYAPMDRMPVFAKAGAIVPMSPLSGWGGLDVPEELNVQVFLGASGNFTLFEDDGVSQEYLQGGYALTQMTLLWEDTLAGQGSQLVISPVEGNASVLPASRVFNFFLNGIADGVEAVVTVNGVTVPAVQAYDSEREALLVQGVRAAPQDDVTVTMKASSLLARRNRLAEKYRAMLKAFKIDSYAKDTLHTYLGTLDAESLLQLVSLINQRNSQLIATVGPQHLHALLELLTGAGAEYITTAQMHESTAIFFDTRQTGATFSSAISADGTVRHECRAYPAAEAASVDVVYGQRFKHTFRAPAA